MKSGLNDNTFRTATVNLDNHCTLSILIDISCNYIMLLVHVRLGSSFLPAKEENNYSAKNLQFQI